MSVYQPYVPQLPPAPGGPAAPARPADALPFRHTVVRFAPTGGTQVGWALHRWFDDPRPHAFALQVGRDPAADGQWEAVGPPVEDAETLVDETKRVWARERDVWYRVALTTPAGVYHSKAIQPGSLLNFREWRLSRDMVRKEQLRHRRYTGVPCVYLRRRRYGARCHRCADAGTGEATFDRCTTCWGTGIDGGYLRPVPDVWVDFDLAVTREHSDEPTGTTRPEALESCRLLGDPRPDSYDVLVDVKGGRRLYIHTVKRVAELNGYTIVSEVELRPADYSDVIHEFPLP